VVIDPAVLTSITGGVSAGATAFFNDGAIIPLPMDRDVKASIIMLKPREHSSVVEEPLALAEIVMPYLTFAISSSVLGVMGMWQDMAVEATARRLESARAVSKVCLFIGQAQTGLLQDARDAGALGKFGDSSYGIQLETLGEDLREAGWLLQSLLYGTLDADREMATAFSTAQLVSAAWENVRDLAGALDAVIEVRGDCSAWARASEISIAVARVLQWFAQRNAESPTPDGTVVRVRCEEQEGRAVVVFEDSSPRLPAALREMLFEPFSMARPIGRVEKKAREHRGLYMPLYLARMLVTLGNNGTLDDRTDELGGGVAGHRLVLLLPAGAA
jgi:hypothetical protein